MTKREERILRLLFKYGSIKSLDLLYAVEPEGVSINVELDRLVDEEYIRVNETRTSFSPYVKLYSITEKGKRFIHEKYGENAYIMLLTGHAWRDGNWIKHP